MLHHLFLDFIRWIKIEHFYSTYKTKTTIKIIIVSVFLAIISITYRSAYTAVLADQPRAAPSESLTIAGKHCESGDVLLPKIQLPKSKTGQWCEWF